MQLRRYRKRFRSQPIANVAPNRDRLKSILSLPCGEQKRQNAPHVKDRVEADGIVLRTKMGISKVYFIELPKEVQERFHYGPATPIAAHRESRPIKLDAKQDAPRQANDRGWVGAMMADPATFGRMLKIFVTVTVIIIGVVLAIIRARS